MCGVRIGRTHKKVAARKNTSRAALMKENVVEWIKYPLLSAGCRIHRCRIHPFPRVFLPISLCGR